MIKEFVERWNKYKENLEKYFRNTKQEKYETYYDIIKLLFEKVINQEETNGYKFNLNNITVVDDGDYQGTQLFIIPLAFPSISLRTIIPPSYTFIPLYS